MVVNAVAGPRSLFAQAAVRNILDHRRTADLPDRSRLPGCSEEGCSGSVIIVTENQVWRLYAGGEAWRGGCEMPWMTTLFSLEMLLPKQYRRRNTTGCVPTTSPGSPSCQSETPESRAALENEVEARLGVQRFLEQHLSALLARTSFDRALEHVSEPLTVAIGLRNGEEITLEVEESASAHSADKLGQEIRVLAVRCRWSQQGREHSQAGQLIFFRNGMVTRLQNSVHPFDHRKNPGVMTIRILAMPRAEDPSTGNLAKIAA